MAFKEYNRNAPVYGEFLAPSSDMVAGRLVCADPAKPGKVKYADNTVATYKILGLLGQNVVAPTYNTHWLMSVHTQYARYGEPVAVFYNDVYWTDQTAVNIAEGDLLYPAAPGEGNVNVGKLSNVQHTVGGVAQNPVGIALSGGNAGTMIKVKLYV